MLVRRFALAVKYANEEYGGNGSPPSSRPTVRKNFKILIERGLLIKDGDYLIINKNLTWKK